MSLTCGCSDDRLDVYNESLRRARKSHTCSECSKKIEPGESYYHVSTLYDRMWESHKVCESCGDLGHSLAELGFCWIIGELREAHRTYIALYTPPKIEK